MTHGDGINILFAVEQTKKVAFCPNKTPVIILKQSLDSNKRQTDGVKKTGRAGKKKKKVHIGFDICTIKKPLAVTYNLK